MVLLASLTWQASAGAAETAVWEQKKTALHPNDSLVAMVFDAQRGVTMCFDGTSTWTWDGTDWKEVSDNTSSPIPYIYGSAMAYDPDRGKVVFYGGEVPLSDPTVCVSKTYEWDGVTWSLASMGTAVPPRSDAVMAYDPVAKVTLMTGGRNADPGTLSDFWAWDGSTWTQKAQSTKLSGAFGVRSMLWDPAGSRMLVAGNSGDLWALSGSDFTQVQSGDVGLRFGPSYAMNTVRNKIVLFGGQTVDAQMTNLDDTWEYGGAWKKMSPAVSPPPRDTAGLAFDSKRRRIVLFSGNAAGSLDDTWEYHTRGGDCTAPDQCDTGACVDGVCCESASCGACEACNLQDHPGECAAVVTAEDPDSCAGDKMCDAEGKCDLKANVSTCKDNFTVLEGDGVTTKSCLPYFCVGGLCEDSCSQTTDCAGGNVCDTATSRCVDATPAASNEDEGGCGCSVPSSPRAPAWLLGACLGMLWARRKLSRGRRADPV
jgi:hypothetical protein